MKSLVFWKKIHTDSVKLLNRLHMDEHLPAGQGTVDWKKVCHALQHLDVRFILESRSIEEGKASLVCITGD